MVEVARTSLGAGHRWQLQICAPLLAHYDGGEVIFLEIGTVHLAAD
jgi:hypothetical protein